MLAIQMSPALIPTVACLRHRLACIAVRTGGNEWEMAAAIFFDCQRTRYTSHVAPQQDTLGENTRDATPVAFS
jgi:hypothetical protein